ncbi:MAG: hypothetical protein ACOC6A_03710 [Chloroflexota bacterium]
MSKPTGNRQSARRHEPRRLPWFAWAVIGLAATTLTVVLCAALGGVPSAPRHSEPAAAILDQLHSLQPNDDFIAHTTDELERYGFQVDLYQGDDVTVDLYGALPDYGYSLLILRAHSGILSHQAGSHREVTRATCLFTNEPYTELKHVKEQFDGQLARARVTEGFPVVFGVGARFVRRSADCTFPNTVVIMMGCSGLQLDDLADAFIDKGASAYLAWDGPVGLDYVDRAGACLVANLCEEGLTLRDAVDRTRDQEGPDPRYGARLKYRPASAGDSTLKQLINRNVPAHS